jgi:hypothetical protein
MVAAKRRPARASLPIIAHTTAATAPTALTDSRANRHSMSDDSRLWYFIGNGRSTWPTHLFEKTGLRPESLPSSLISGRTPPSSEGEAYTKRLAHPRLTFGFTGVRFADALSPEGRNCPGRGKKPIARSRVRLSQGVCGTAHGQPDVAVQAGRDRPL